MSKPHIYSKYMYSDISFLRLIVFSNFTYYRTYFNKFIKLLIVYSYTLSFYHWHSSSNYHNLCYNTTIRNWPRVEKSYVSLWTICWRTLGIVTIATHVYNPSCDSWTGSTLRVRDPSRLLVIVMPLLIESVNIQVSLMFGDKLSSIAALQIIENDSPIIGAPSRVIVTTGTGRAIELKIFV